MPHSCAWAPAAALALLAACDGAADAPGEAGPPKVTAEQLGQAYAESESAAQAKYGNRDLVVAGTVTNVTVDAADHAVIRMKGSDELHDVFLTLFDEETARAAEVKRGDALTLHCEGATLVIGSPTLDGCTFEDGDRSEAAK